MTRAPLAQTFVAIGVTLVDDFDIVDVLTSLSDCCVEILDVDGAGIMLVGSDGALQATASSSEVMRLVELLDLQSEEGPCLDCYRSGQRVVNQDLTTVNGRWPKFVPVAVAAGFLAADAVPMRLGDKVIDVVNLFSTEPGALDDNDLIAAKALADVATIAILQQRRIFDAEAVNG